MKRLAIIVAVLAVAVLSAWRALLPAAAAGRAATLTGAAEAPYTVAGWQAGNTAIGPLQTQRIFYPGQLPATYPGSYCDQLEQATGSGITCVISYKTPDTNVAAYVSSIPASVHAVFTWYHEPEAPGRFPSGASFVAGFTSQTALIRQAAGCRGAACHIQTTMTAMAWQYQDAAHTGYACTYIPPAATLDMYSVDVYRPAPDGQPLPSSEVAAQWNNWLRCASAANTSGLPYGIPEYGIGTSSGDTVRASTITADAGYLKQGPGVFGLWEYWDESNSVSGGCTPSNCDWRIQGHAGPAAAWQAGEGAPVPAPGSSSASPSPSPSPAGSSVTPAPASSPPPSPSPTGSASSSPAGSPSPSPSGSPAPSPAPSTSSPAPSLTPPPTPTPSPTASPSPSPSRCWPPGHCKHSRRHQ